MKRVLPLVLFCCCFIGLATPGFASSSVWTEFGSAGNLPSTANITNGTGILSHILGNLSSNTEVDLFQITITNVLHFSATTEAGTLFVDDPQLFLFNSEGFAVYMNDDGTGFGSQSHLPAGHALGPVSPGLYYLGIGWFDNEPFSALGYMFEDTSFDPEAIGGPGPGGFSPLLGWDNNVTGRPDLPTDYSIQLTGAAFANEVPEPPILALLAAGLAVVAGLRRRFERLAEH